MIKEVPIMVYDFVAKVKKVEVIQSAEELENAIKGIDSALRAPFEVKFLLEELSKTGDVLVKAKASVSSLYEHDRELEITVATFVEFLEAIAHALGGEVSTNEAFYNNSKHFNKLYS